MSLAPSRILGHDNWSVIYEFMNDKIGYQRYIFYSTILSCFLSLVNFLDSSQVQASFLLALQENYSPLLPVGFSSAMLKFLCLVVPLFYNTTSLFVSLFLLCLQSRCWFHLFLFRTEASSFLWKQRPPVYP